MYSSVVFVQWTNAGDLKESFPHSYLSLSQLTIHQSFFLLLSNYNTCMPQMPCFGYALTYLRNQASNLSERIAVLNLLMASICLSGISRCACAKTTGIYNLRCAYRCQITGDNGNCSVSSVKVLIRTLRSGRISCLVVIAHVGWCIFRLCNYRKIKRFALIINIMTQKRRESADNCDRKQRNGDYEMMAGDGTW